MTKRAERTNRFNLLRLRSQPTGPLITFVRCDFDEKDLLKLVRNVRYFSESNEYLVFSGTFGRKTVNFLGTGSGPASLLTALYELIPSKIECLVRIGAGGGLNGARTQEVVNVRTALCMDAVSSSLGRTKRVAADSRLTHRISEALGRNGVKSALENGVSVDAMYLFEKNVDRAESQRAYCWDLETATTLTFSREFGIRAASVLYVVSDRAGNTIRKLRFVLSVLEALSI